MQTAARPGPSPAVSRAESDPGGLRAALMRWYRANGRHGLPWRANADPYAILVSEMMLQQTTVAAVIPFHARFLARFPTVHALAAAPEQDVLAAWSGLGYYRRARLLHGAARAVLDAHGGVFPRDVPGLAALPGLGRYTAGAVAAFAFDTPAPIVEANTARLYARLAAIEGPLNATPAARRLWEVAEALLPLGPGGGRDHDSALMDLGSAVCVPVAPKCGVCPVAAWCGALTAGRVAEIPARTAKPEKLSRRFAAAVIARPDGRLLVRRHEDGEWHAGLFGFPSIRLEDDADPMSDPGAAPALGRLLGPVAEAAVFRPFAELRYTVTRHAVRLGLHRAGATSAAARKPLPPGEWRWHSVDEIGELPIGSATRRALKLLADPDDFLTEGP